MKQTKSIRKISPLAIITGLGIACVFSLAAAFLGALLINKENISENGVAIFPIVVHFLSAVLGCFITERFSSSNKILASGITALSYYLVLLAMSSTFFGGVSVNFWTGIFSVLASQLLLTLWIVKPQKNSKHRKRKVVCR